jgi:hypothetical protein
MWAKAFPMLLAAGCIAACGGSHSVVLPESPTPNPVASVDLTRVRDTIRMYDVVYGSWYNIGFYDAAGKETRCLTRPTIRSSDTTVAIVRHLDDNLNLAFGTVYPVHGGATTISVACDGVTGSKVVTVMEIVSITVAPATATLSVGQDSQFVATVVAIPGFPDGGLYWGGGYEGLGFYLVATVDSTGKVHAVAPGVTTITVSSRWGGDAYATLTVLP